MSTFVSLVWFSALVVCAVPSLALAAPTAAGPKPLPASQHTPPVILDEASAQIALVSCSTNGYVFRSHIEMSGFTSKTDTAHID